MNNVLRIDDGGCIDVIYMDFMKACDTVPHKRLIGKLKSYGLSPKIINWIKSFLSDRKQRVIVKGECSKECRVTSGIPQGSVLGPILFVLYINDLPEIVNSPVYIFADDTKLYRQISNNNDKLKLQQDLDSLQIWSDTWLLKFLSRKKIEKSLLLLPKWLLFL